MAKRVAKPDSRMTAAEWRIARRLTRVRLAHIDTALLKETSARWRKVARVVGMAMSGESRKVKGVPDALYANRLRLLVRRGVLVVQGNIGAMRYCEVRLAEGVPHAI